VVIRLGRWVPLLSLLLLPAVAAAQTDYERELAGIGKKLAEAEAVPATGAPAQEVERATKIAFLAYRRASLTASYPDFKAAETAIDGALLRIGPSEDLYLLKANFDFKLHRLAQTQQDLAHAPDLADDPQVVALRADLAFQEGRYDEARKGYEAVLARKRSWDQLARLAYYKSRTADRAGADRLYAEAGEEITAKEMRSYAWVELQRGLLAFDAGHPEEALARYRRADRAYSGYWLIEEHIAEALGILGRTAEAAALYRRLVERTHNPEFLSALALLVEPGDPAAARALDQEAQQSFQEQSRLYPEAALGHRLESLFRRRETSPELLAMALQNVALRPNGDAKLLLARAYLKLGDPAAARALVDEIGQMPWRSPALASLSRQIEAERRKRR
jgi:tetratricopeptide (TPR) repeat protein